MVNDLLKMGKASTYKTQGMSEVFSNVSGGIGAKSVDKADTIKAVGQGAAQAVQQALGR